MKVGNVTQTETFRVMKDPRSKATQAELDESVRVSHEVARRDDKANDAVKLVRNIRAQLTDRTAKLPRRKRGAFARRRIADSRASLGRGAEIYQVQNSRVRIRSTIRSGSTTRSRHSQVSQRARMRDRQIRRSRYSRCFRESSRLSWREFDELSTSRCRRSIAILRHRTFRPR